jgi:hypothetical protein
MRPVSFGNQYHDALHEHGPDEERHAIDARRQRDQQATHGYVDLIGSDETPRRFGVGKTHSPPPLFTHDLDMQGIASRQAFERIASQHALREQHEQGEPSRCAGPAHLSQSTALVPSVQRTQLARRRLRRQRIIAQRWGFRIQLPRTPTPDRQQHDGDHQCADGRAER